MRTLPGGPPSCKIPYFVWADGDSIVSQELVGNLCLEWLHLASLVLSVIKPTIHESEHCDSDVKILSTSSPHRMLILLLPLLFLRLH